MREATLVRKNLTRRLWRTFLSLLAVCIAFLVFGLMSAFRAGVEADPSGAGLQRLLVSNKVSFTQPLPLGYWERIAATPGVAHVTHRTWFSGYYRVPQNFIVTYAVDPKSYFKVRDDSGVSPDAIKKFQARRDAALVGTAVARRFGFQVGDRLVLSSTMYARRTGGRSWDFEIVGLIPSATEQAQNTILMDYDYLNESRTWGSGTVSQFIVSPSDPRESETVVRSIDALFANSIAETATMTEAAFNQAFAAQFADVALIVLLVTGAAFLSILMIVGSTMIVAVRERMREIAVLVSLGFDQGRIARQITSEALVITILGGLTGLWLAGGILGVVRTAAKGQFDHFVLTADAFFLGLGLAILFGLLVSVPPIVMAIRMNLPNALRRG